MFFTFDFVFQVVINTWLSSHYNHAVVQKFYTYSHDFLKKDLRQRLQKRKGVENVAHKIFCLLPL